MAGPRVPVATLCLYMSVLLASRGILFTRSLNGSSSSASSTVDSDDGAPFIPALIGLDSDEESRCNADLLVQQAYERTYKPLVSACMENMTYVDCLRRELTKEQLRQQTDLPWWLYNLYHTVLVRNGGVRGIWHELWFPEPRVKFCSIEKVGTTQWRAVHVQAHNITPLKKMGWERNELHTDMPSAVFLRDPLERFLSGYINKCERSTLEGHCEPTAIFHNGNLVRSLKKKRHHFESFIAAMPFSWNVHFPPQALYCQGLFRTINDYDFVGSMDTNAFPADLQRFREQYAGPLSDHVQAVFRFESNVTDYHAVMEKQKRLHHSTNAPKYVLEYYSAEAVRRVLEYLSIDYMTLNLTIPDWAREILRADCKPHAIAAAATATTT